MRVQNCYFYIQYGYCIINTLNPVRLAFDLNIATWVGFAFIALLGEWVKNRAGLYVLTWTDMLLPVFAFIRPSPIVKFQN